jgi:YD repeat-containing protein
VTKINEADGGSINFDYDKNGKLQSAATRDAKGLLKKVEIPGGDTTVFEHDDNGFVVGRKVTSNDGRLVETAKVLKDGGLVSRQYIDGKLDQQVLFDNAKNVSKILRADGRASEFTYDNDNQATSRIDRDKDGHIYRVLNAKELKAERELYNTAESIAKSTEKLAAGLHNLSLNYYDQIQDMWKKAQTLPGDAKLTLQDAINESIKTTGVTVRIVETNEKNSTDSYRRNVAAMMHVEKRGTQSRHPNWVGLEKIK